MCDIPTLKSDIAMHCRLPCVCVSNEASHHACMSNEEPHLACMCVGARGGSPDQFEHPDDSHGQDPARAATAALEGQPCQAAHGHRGSGQGCCNSPHAWHAPNRELVHQAPWWSHGSHPLPATGRFFVLFFYSSCLNPFFSPDAICLMS